MHGEESVLSGSWGDSEGEKERMPRAGRLRSKRDWQVEAKRRAAIEMAWLPIDRNKCGGEEKEKQEKGGGRGEKRPESMWPPSVNNRCRAKERKKREKKRRERQEQGK